MNLIYLKYFYDAALAKSISAAARSNFVSQSAISQGIQKLEHSLKKPLITHRRNVFKLTMEGEIVFEACKDLFKLINNLQTCLETDSNELRGTLLFACSHSISLSLLPKPLSLLKKEFPLVKPSFRLANTTQTMNLILQGSIEFGIVLDNTDLSRFDKIKLDQGFFQLFYSDKFNIGKEIQTEYLLTEDQKETLLLKDAFRERYKKDLVTQMEISSWEVIANFIEQGIGIGLIPDFLTRGVHRQAKFKVYDLALPPLPYNIYAIYPKREQLSKNAQYFLSLF